MKGNMSLKSIQMGFSMILQTKQIISIQSFLLQNACSVRVAVRVRPLIGRELNDGAQKTCVDADQYRNKILIGDKDFQFDKVFDPNGMQEDIFDICGKNLILGCFAGYNATILAYGQTGSGKTHTMGTGSTVGLSEEQIGIVPRVFSFIFEELERRKKMTQFSEFTIKCSFIELYNEELHDLFDPTTIGAVDRITGKPVKELLIREEKNGAITIQNIKEEVVNSQEECLTLLNKGIAHRTTNYTLMNESSSRSHGIFTVTIQQRIQKEIGDVLGVEEGKSPEQQVTGSSEEQITAKFTFVDLAGSERIKKTGATGQIMKEGISINKGLLSLGNVISALTEDSKRVHHIPYRDSKLTRILQDSLGGNSRTTMIACVSPAESNYEESLNAVKYASRARNIKNKPVVNRDPNSPQHSGTINFQEIRDIKIKLSRKEKELKETLENLEQAAKKSLQKDLDYEALLNERDSLRVRNEIFSQYLQQNNIQIEGDTSFNTLELQIYNSTLTLIDEYKTKFKQYEFDLEKRNTELYQKGQKIAELQMQNQRDEELLRKHLEEKEVLKRQLKKQEALIQSNNNQAPSNLNIQQKSPINRTSSPSNKQGKTVHIPREDKNHQRRVSQLDGLMIEDFNEKFINNLANKLESIFVSPGIEESSLQSLSKRESYEHNKDISRISKHDLKLSLDESDLELLMDDDNQNIQVQTGLDEKEKILEAVKNSAKIMQSELVELMKSEYQKKISELEMDLQKTELERKDSIKKVSNDQKQVQSIENQFKVKVDELAKQLQEYKEKERKQDTVVKQISTQENKIKGLESDIQKMKKTREEMEKQMKLESDKFSKFKKKTVSELDNAKKNVLDKEKVVYKLKQDLKKTDQLAQNKIFELKGLQKRAQESRQKREQEKNQSNEKNGVDIDLIKNWINENTQKMLRHSDIKEQLEKQMDERERIEDEMLADGDKLIDYQLKKERKEIEKSELESEIEIDEGQMLELEEELDSLCVEITNITEGLDSMDQTLDFINKRINDLTQELSSIDVENIEPLQFKGLHSVDAARVTLQTFFAVLLDLNVYKRDLEQKCIEQDEAILDMNEKIRLLQIRIEEIMSNGNPSAVQHAQSENTNKIIQMHKDKAIKNIVDSLDGFVEYQDLKHLNLTPNEQNSLTKLSLSKIVNNLKIKLKEEEQKNVNLSHKLEQASNEKEQYRLKFDNLKRQKNDGKAKDPSSNNANSALNQSMLSQSNPKYATSKLSSLNLENNNPQPPQKRISSLQFKFKQMTANTKKVQSSEDVGAIAQPAIKQGSSRNGNLHQFKSQQSAQNLTNQNSTKKVLQRKSSSLDKDKEQSPRQMQKTPRKPEIGKGNGTVQKNDQQKQEALSIKKKQQFQQLSPIAEHKQGSLNTSQLQQPSHNLKDRRNQRKLETHHDEVVKQVHEKSRSNSNSDMHLILDEKFLEIEKIKENAHLVGPQHMQRRQSRVREYSKLKERDFGGVGNGSGSSLQINFQAQHLSLFQDQRQPNPQNRDDNDNSPRMDEQNYDNGYEDFQQPQINIEQFDNQKQGGLEILDTDQEEYSQQDIQYLPPSPSKDQRNKWIQQRMIELQNYGQALVDFDCVNDRLIMLFDNFTIRECSLQQRAETKQINLQDLIKNGDSSDVATACGIDKELGLIAVANQTGVFVFDYADNFAEVTKIYMSNVIQVLFCQYYLVIMASNGVDTTISCYQLDDEPVELGAFSLDNEGKNIIMKTDATHLYVAHGNLLGKLSVPDLNVLFLEETPHIDQIMDFSISDPCIVTTSFDKSLRVFNIDTGMPSLEPIEDLECDHLEAEGNFVLTACGNGAAVIVWKHSANKKELELIDELELEQMEEQVLGFKMKGGVSLNYQGIDCKILLLITTTAEKFIINSLQHKMRSF